MVNPIDKTGSIFDDLGLSVRQAAPSEGNLNQEDFLELMLAQLRHQDPLSPLENDKFLGQIAQFSTVSGISELNTSFHDLAGALQSNRALQASELVGRSVMVPSENATLETGDAVSGAVEIPQTSTAVTVSVLDAAGQVVRSFELGPQPGGRAAFNWDGLNDSGQPQPPADYRIQVEALIDGESVGLTPLISSKVESVSLGQGSEDIVLNVRGVGAIPLSAVEEIS